MAHAQFHKNQRVYVRPVGTWALIERVVPQWTKGLESPIRIFYDVGLGREFGADELQADTSETPESDEQPSWRVIRARNKWQSTAETMNHPFPGTHPVVVTGDVEWGGWRVSAAEYALSPGRIETQARMIASLPRLHALMKKLSEWTEIAEVPTALRETLRECGEAIASAGDSVE
ncbi:MAG TPA: hypothetical protein VHT51_00100 [Micropepsaceae bacterium]|jgi:hypothetical protein|nr:hypothetical protein [Micropepsaceae bacterium]